jgi:hypothetical protein
LRITLNCFGILTALVPEVSATIISDANMTLSRVACNWVVNS